MQAIRVQFGCALIAWQAFTWRSRTATKTVLLPALSLFLTLLKSRLKICFYEYFHYNPGFCCKNVANTPSLSCNNSKSRFWHGEKVKIRPLDFNARLLLKSRFRDSDWLIEKVQQLQLSVQNRFSCCTFSWTNQNAVLDFDTVRTGMSKCRSQNSVFKF